MSAPLDCVRFTRKPTREPTDNRLCRGAGIFRFAGPLSRHVTTGNNVGCGLVRLSSPAANCDDLMVIEPTIRTSKVLIACVLALGCATLAVGAERVAFTRDGETMRVEGKVIVEAQDGGLLLMDRQGRLWDIQRAQVTHREEDGDEFQPLTQEQLGAELLAEMPAGFRVHTTAHYSICYNTSPAYAHWCGALFERLYRGFGTYWSERGLPAKDPEQPLVALIFDTRQSYSAYAQHELGESTPATMGYYSLRTNRVSMFDLTGVDELRAEGSRRGSAQHINRILSQPAAERTVATIIHEATHQLVFNRGLQMRYADIPVWQSEGLAIYFETPDLGASKGWRRIGSVNEVRRRDFLEYMKARPGDSLTTLLQDDSRFRSTKTAPHAYAEAWALSYFLIKRYPRQYASYLQTLAAKKPLSQDSPTTRLDEFKAAFGADLSKLDEEFLRSVLRLP